MIITPIDSSNRIFQVTDIFPADVVDAVLNLNWDVMPWLRGPLQEKWNRRHVDTRQNTTLDTVSTYIWNQLVDIERICNVTFTNRYPATTWWYDEPGFDVNIHTDGHLPATMQIFWIASGEEFATQFYRSKNPTDSISDLKFIPNTGYIMLNGLDYDGSQPLQWHGMLNKVPADTFRLTSYTVFGAYENK